MNLQKKRVTAILLASALSVSSIGYNTHKKNTSSQSPITSDSEMKREDASFNLLKLKIDEIETTYDFEDFYLTDKDIKRIIKSAENIKKCDNKNTDIESIYQQIIDNSRYLSENIELFASSSEFSSKFMNSLYYAILESLASSFDIREDICHLTTLSIINKDLSDTNAEAYYNPYLNRIYIDCNYILGLYNPNDQYLIFDHFRRTLQHEINHCREYICDCRRKKGQLNDSVQYHDTLCSTIEAAAESQVIFIDGYKNSSSSDFVYQSERKGEAQLLLLAAFNQNKKIDQYFQAIFDTDLIALYDFYGLENEKEIKKFYQISYALDYLNNRNNFASVLNKKSHFSDYQKQAKIINYSYKIDLFKMVLQKFINNIQENNDLSLNEIMYLYKFIKNTIIKDIPFEIENEELTICTIQFINNFNQIETSFYNYICSYYNIDLLLLF